MSFQTGLRVTDNMIGIHEKPILSSESKTASHRAGYPEFCISMNDPGHNEYEAVTDWYGGDFDSEAFDADYVNRELAKFMLWSRDRIPGWEKDD